MDALDGSNNHLVVLVNAVSKRWEQVVDRACFMMSFFAQLGLGLGLEAFHTARMTEHKMKLAAKRFALERGWW